MRETGDRARRIAGAALLILLTIPAARVARAQPADEAPPPAAEEAPPTPAVRAETKPPTATEAMPAARPETLPPIEVGAWVRVGALFQGHDQSKINDWSMDTAYVELHTGGRITKMVGVTLNLDANITSLSAQPGANAQSYVGVEDAIIAFDFLPEFHLWGGHLLVPIDRSNAGGPWFNVMWNFPGIAVGALPRTSSALPTPWNVGRNNGAVFWGDVAGGRFSYYAGAFDNGADLATNVNSPLFSGRLRLAILDPETGYWGNTSYFGQKDILSIDVGAQYQKNGNTPGPGNYTELNAGVLFEKKLPSDSWFTAEGAFYHYGLPDGLPGNSFYVLAAYATPRIGIGNIQPAVRYQMQEVKGGTLPNPWNIDGAVAYLLKGPALRVIATCSHTKSTSVMSSTGSANSIQIGAQGIFF